MCGTSSGDAVMHVERQDDKTSKEMADGNTECGGDVSGDHNISNYSCHKNEGAVGKCCNQYIAAS